MARGTRTGLVIRIGIGLLCAASPGAARADEVGRERALEDRIIERDDRIQALEETVQTLAEELSRLRTEVAVPEEPALTSEYGFGPAASKVYGIERGLSLGGYGEGTYTNYVGDDGSGPDKQLDVADALRTVLYVGYRFSENILFHSEIEFEHASTEEEGAVSVEFAALDFLWREELNGRMGLLLLPMGFINEIHEPPFFYGVHRPETDRALIPTTWRENGVGIFGSWRDTLTYRAYVVNGFDATGFSASGIRGGRQNGSEALAEDFAVVARLDWTPSESWLFGGSVYTGDSGQDQYFMDNELPDARLTTWEVHGQYQGGQLDSRILFTMTHLGSAGALNRALEKDLDDAIADTMLGGYYEIAYDLWPTLFGNSEKVLAPFFRVEYVDTQYDVPSGYTANRNNAAWIYTPGINFQPHSNVVLKMEYRNFDAREGERADELSVGMGYVF